MKNRVLLAVFCLLPFSVAMSQQWEWLIPKPHGQIICAVGSVGRDTLFAGCTGGIVQRSVDGGTSWTAWKLGTQAVTALYCADRDHIWIGSGGSILFSSNLGESWTEQFNTGSVNISRLLFRDASTGYALSAGSLYRTMDGGENWEATKLGTTISACSLAEDGALFASIDSTIYRSVDMAQTWTPLTRLSFAPGGLKFLSGQRGVAYSSSTQIMGTTNGGKAWTKMGFYSPLKVTDMFFLDSMRLVLLIPTNPGLLNLSTDFGETWTTPSLQPALPGYVRSAWIDRNNAAAIFGMYGGIIVKSVDTLRTWTLIHGYGSEYGRNIPLFTHNGEGILLSGANNIAEYSRTRDYGRTWSIENFPNNISPVSPLFLHDSCIYAVLGKEPSVGFAVTRDVGKTWEIRGRLPADTIIKWAESNLKSGDARSGDIWFSCSGGAVFCSEDQGYTWKLTHIEENDLSERSTLAYRISAPEKDAVYVLATTRVYISNDKGLTWRSQKVSSKLGLRLGDMHFISRTTGFVVDKAYNMMFRTTNGGNNWEQILDVTANKLYFLDSLHGWATSSASIAKTSDGGATWISSSLDELYNITNMFFLTPDEGWMTGLVREGSTSGGGVTLRYTKSGGINSVERVHANGNSFTLGSTYPNPVAVDGVVRLPIRFTTSRAAAQRTILIELYDLTGRWLMRTEEGATYSDSGTYLLRIGNLVPGTYYYTVRIANEIQAGTLLVQ